MAEAHSTRLARWRPALLRRFGLDQRGVTAIEFALLAVPFFAIIAAILETALVFLAGQVLDSALHDANRRILTGQAQQQNFSINEFREAICDHTFGLFDCSAIHIVVNPITDFASATVVPPIEDDCDDPCEWTVPERFNPGGGSSVVLVRAYYRWPILVNFGGFGLANLPDNTRLLASVRVFRNEPFTWGSGAI